MKSKLKQQLAEISVDYVPPELSSHQLEDEALTDVTGGCTEPVCPIAPAPAPKDA